MTALDRAIHTEIKTAALNVLFSAYSRKKPPNMASRANQGLQNASSSGAQRAHDVQGPDSSRPTSAAVVISRSAADEQNSLARFVSSTRTLSYLRIAQGGDAMACTLQNEHDERHGDNAREQDLRKVGERERRRAGQRVFDESDGKECDDAVCGNVVIDVLPAT
jgi:hypothetical protein